MEGWFMISNIDFSTNRYLGVYKGHEDSLKAEGILELTNGEVVWFIKVSFFISY
jgi:hypothetical protein